MSIRLFLALREMLVKRVVEFTWIQYSLAWTMYWIKLSWYWHIISRASFSALVPTRLKMIHFFTYHFASYKFIWNTRWLCHFVSSQDFNTWNFVVIKFLSVQNWILSNATDMLITFHLQFLCNRHTYLAHHHISVRT